MPDEPSPNLSVAHGEFSPCLSERSRDILHSLTCERQTHYTDNNTRSSNDSLRCRAFTQQLGSHICASQGGQLPSRCNMTDRCNPHREQNENVTQGTQHTHYRSRSCVLASFACRSCPVPPGNRCENQNAQKVARKVH